MNEPHPINGFNLIVAILHELERQMPGGRIDQLQMNVTTLACNAIADAMCGRSGIVVIETGTPHE